MQHQQRMRLEGVGQNVGTAVKFRLKNSLDAWLIAGALLHGALLMSLPSIPIVALGMWWNANTVSHNFIHRPFFQTRRQNQVFSAALTLLLGLPQELWRQRHLAHHRQSTARVKLNVQFAIETSILLTFWSFVLATSPEFVFKTYLPGWLLGLGLCQLHGYFEHHRGTISHYGRLYNLFLFNDGFHREHHRKPSEHWSTLPKSTEGGNARISSWPAVLRFLDYFSLDSLERYVAGSKALQKWIIGIHKRAIVKALVSVAKPRNICIVGGGIFPRTALILCELYPDATFCIIDHDTLNLDEAKPWLKHPVQYLAETYDPERHAPFDLITIPLAYRGNRKMLYQGRPGAAFLIHDWIWRGGRGAIVSWLLLKRINLVAL
jgi:hypothetical protein